MNVFFVCVANSGRSVMAERLFRQAAGDRYQARSAGSEPGTAPHPQVVEALRELGIDASDHAPRKHDQEALHDVEDWDVDDPAGQPLEKVREIRNEIEQRVLDLLAHADAIRADCSAHARRLEQLLPRLVDEFADARPAEEIRACADAILSEFDDVPVRTFVLTLAERRVRDCLRRPVFTALAS
jgi:arsenate reductase